MPFIFSHFLSPCSQAGGDGLESAGWEGEAAGKWTCWSVVLPNALIHC